MSRIPVASLCLCVLGAVSLLALLAAGCAGKHPSLTKVPPVDTTSLGTALKRLKAAGLRVALSDFGPMTPDYTIEAAPVGDQDPEPGTRVPRGSIVQLNMHGVEPIPSPAVPLHHPKFATVPSLVGKQWPQAERALTGGYWIQIGHVPALSAREPNDVLSSYIVSGQTPSAGTRVPYGGTKTRDGGFRPTVIQLRIAGG
jgi:beta-lactam-binding protein with PASTA domain